MSSTWRQPERSNSFFLHLIHLIVRFLGRGAGRLLLYPIVGYFYLTSPRARAASRDFLSHVHGRRARVRDVFMHIYTFAVTLLDRLLLFSGRYPALDVRLHRRESLRQEMAGRGCVLIVSHLGSFEVLRVLGRERGGLPIRIVMDRRPGAKLERLLKRLNPRMTETIIDGSKGKLRCVLEINEALQRGEMVGIMADRVESGERSALCNFIGRRAAFPLTPWLLAGILGVPVILCFGLYRGGKRYDLYFEMLAEQLVLGRGTRERDAAYWAQRYAERLAEYACSAPENWFNFYPFWEDDGEREKMRRRRPAPHEIRD